MPAPANDNFANRITLATGGGSRTGDSTRDATVEVNEPVGSATDSTIWFELTTGADAGVWYFHVSNAVLTTQFDLSYLAFRAYTGSTLATLVQYGNQDLYSYQGFYGILSRYHYLLLDANTTYKILVYSPDFGQGLNTYVVDSFDLDWYFGYVWPDSPIPANDNLANAILLTGGTGTVSGTTAGSTVETGAEFDYFGSYQGRSVWYKCPVGTSPADFTLTITAVPLDPTSYPYVEVYYSTGTPVDYNSLTYVDSMGQPTLTPNPLMVTIPANKIMYIFVTGWDFDLKRYTFDLGYTGPPPFIPTISMTWKHGD